MPNTVTVVEIIVDHCLAKSLRACVMSEGASSTAYAWKITHWKPHHETEATHAYR